MPKLIALCDGHGLETPGKRTPTLPDGSYMKENEFNRRVVELLTKHLQRCGFAVLLVAPTDADTPLKARTDTANKARADLYVSIHANATGGEGWTSARGIETFHYPGSVKGKQAAEIIQRNLLAGTPLPNRGVKQADFHVLRETTMPAVLIEAAFMTNREDAKLLMSEVYRSECAEELARGICEYFAFAFKREGEVSAVIKGTRIEAVKSIDGVTYVPLRAAADAAGMKTTWNAQTLTATAE
jgi:N-acetylmuramoyl-L-alanine amidase